MELSFEPKKCDRCGIEIVGVVDIVRDGGVAHRNPLECVAYILQKSWLLDSLMLEHLQSVDYSLQRMKNITEDNNGYERD